MLGLGGGAAQRERNGAILAQLRTQGFQAIARGLIAVGRGRIGIHNQIDFAAQIVHHGQFLREHQQNIGRADAVGLGRLLETVGEMLEMVNGFVAEIAHQAAGEARQAGDFRRVEAGVELLDKMQWVAVMGFHDAAVFIHLNLLAR